MLTPELKFFIVQSLIAGDGGALGGVGRLIDLIFLPESERTKIIQAALLSLRAVEQQRVDSGADEVAAASKARSAATIAALDATLLAYTTAEEVIE